MFSHVRMAIQLKLSLGRHARQDALKDIDCDVDDLPSVVDPDPPQREAQAQPSQSTGGSSQPRL